MTQTTDITRKLGDTYPAQVTITDADGNPFDLTGTTLIRLGVDLEGVNTPPDDATVLSSGTLDADPTTGMVVFDMTGPISIMDAGSYKADIRFTQNGFVRTTDDFKFKVEGTIITSVV